MPNSTYHHHFQSGLRVITALRRRNASVCFTILDELFTADAVNIIHCVEIDRPYCCLPSLKSAVLRHGLRIANLHQTLNCNIKRSFTPVIGELEDVAGAAGRISVNVTFAEEA